MPLARAIPRALAALCGLALSACASAPTLLADNAGSVTADSETGSGTASTALMPRDVRLGLAGMVIQRVENEVSRDEVAAAIRPMLQDAPVCMRWPALWIEQANRNGFVARYDLMARDWGEDAALGAEARMEEYVDMGFLNAAPLDSNPRVVTYSLTAEGERYFSGLIEPGRRPSFCAPAERSLVEITAMEWGEYPCGTLRVRFRHASDDWPSWARTETARARYAERWPSIGTPAPGSVTLARQWYNRGVMPPGFSNGALRSACYDAGRGQIIGDDLDLSAIPVD